MLYEIQPTGPARRLATQQVGYDQKRKSVVQRRRLQIPYEHHDPNITLWASWSLITYLTNIMIRASYYEHHDRKSHTLRTSWSEHHIMSIMIVDHIPYEHYDPNIILWASWSWITYLTKIMIRTSYYEHHDRWSHTLRTSWSEHHIMSIMIVNHIPYEHYDPNIILWASWS